MSKFDRNKFGKEATKRFEKMRVVILSPVMFDYPKFWQSLVNMMAYSWNMGLRVQEMGITERTGCDLCRLRHGQDANAACVGRERATTDRRERAHCGTVGSVCTDFA